MKKQILTSLIFLCMAFNAMSSVLVEVEFIFDNTKYLPGQTVWAETKVKNISDKPIIFAYSQSSDYLVYNSNGEKAENSQPSLPTIAEKILPDSTISIGPSKVLLYQYFNNDNEYVSLPVGHYTIRCSIDIYPQGSEGKIVGQAVRSFESLTNPAKPLESITKNLYFDIVEPSSEDKAAFEAITSIKQKQKKNYKANVTLDYKDVAAKHPKSSYAPECLYNYIYGSLNMPGAKGKGFDTEAIKQFFNEYPDSRYAVSVSRLLWCHYDYQGMTRSQIKQELNKWREQHKGKANVVKMIDRVIYKMDTRDPQYIPMSEVMKRRKEIKDRFGH